MNLNLKKVQFSRNDLRNKIKIPTQLDINLAYFVGFHYGDGYLKKTVRKGKVDYRLSYNGNLFNEFNWYKKNIKQLILALFNKKINVRKTKTNTVLIEFRSKAIFTFLHDVCNIPQSPKNEMSIPLIILDSNDKIKASFLRGLADTDFSVTFKTRKKSLPYPVIDYQIKDKVLRNEVAKVLEQKGFNFSIGEREKIRKGNKSFSYCLQISGRNNLKKWLNEIGFNNPKHLKRIEAHLGPFRLRSDSN